ncbi:MAG: type II secretion system protein GspM [Pseudomonadota bacterium]
MRLEQLQPRERRIVAVGLLLAVIIVFLMLVVVPAFQWFSQARDSVADTSFRLERLQAASAQLPQLRAEVRALESALDRQDLTQRESSESLASAALQQRVSEIIEAHGGDTQSTRVQSAVEEDGLQRIGLRIEMQAETGALAEILAALEAARPLLFVDRISVSAQREADRQRRYAYHGLTEVNLEVAAYWRPEPDSAGEAEQ